MFMQLLFVLQQALFYIQLFIFQLFCGLCYLPAISPIGFLEIHYFLQSSINNSVWSRIL